MPIWELFAVPRLVLAMAYLGNKFEDYSFSLCKDIKKYIKMDVI